MYLFGWNAIQREHVDVTVEVAVLPKMRKASKPFPCVERNFKPRPQNDSGMPRIIHDMIITTERHQYLVSGYQESSQPLNAAVGRLGESWRGEISVMVMGGNRYFLARARHLKDLDDAVAL